MYDLGLEWYTTKDGRKDALFATCPKCGYRGCGRWPKKLGKPHNYHCRGCGVRYRLMEDDTYEPLALTKLELILHVAP